MIKMKIFKKIIDGIKKEFEEIKTAGRYTKEQNKKEISFNRNKKEKKPKKDELENLKFYSWIIIIALYFFLVYLTFKERFGYLQNMTQTDIGVVLGSQFIIIIAGAISIFCGKKCYEYAKEIKKDVYVAYFTGFIFSIVGLIFYYWWNTMETAND